ncbi:MAG TPA: cytochrome c [Anaerolineales bacterium]|nr:cytochrome c [Anaerolineales bacterium]
MRRKVFYTIFIAGVLLLVACGASQTEEAFTPAPVPSEFAGKTDPFGVEAASAGAEVFRSNCESCHGPQGHGDGVAGQALDPKPKNLADLQAVVGDDYLFWRIYEGKPGTAMIAWNGILTDEQIWQAVSFIRTLK